MIRVSTTDVRELESAASVRISASGSLEINGTESDRFQSSSLTGGPGSWWYVILIRRELRIEMRTTDSATRLWVLPALIAAAVMASATPGWCQGSLGGLTGRVTDASGAPVSGVAIKIENLETSAEIQVSTTT